MTTAEFLNVTSEVLKDFQEAVPNPKTRYVSWYINAYGNKQRGSTGNMAYNASRIKYPDSNTAVIYVDEHIAPYVPYTNEVWISPKWKGKKNPNQGWFERARDIVIESLARRCGGEVIKKQ